MIRILVADDHAIVRRGLVWVLDAEEDLRVVAEADTPGAARDRARLGDVDVVLLDLQFTTSALRGIAVVPELRAIDPPPAVVVLTTYDNDQDVLEAMEAGASGYLLKDSPPEELVASVRRAALGSRVVDARVRSRLDSGDPAALSEREREVLRLVAAGRTNAQIAAELFLSQATVKTHLVHVFDKLGAGSRTDAVARARARGILRPDG
jgi:DNA-binding NarL/FixJ family response regulator